MCNDLTRSSINYKTVTIIKISDRTKWSGKSYFFPQNLCFTKNNRLLKTFSRLLSEMMVSFRVVFP